MNLVKIFELVKMALVIVGFLFSLATIIVAIRNKEFNDEIIDPWAKEERRAAKRAEKEQKREARRQAKYWRDVEKQYR